MLSNFRLSALWENNYIRVRVFGTAPRYRGRALVVSLWWHDDCCKTFSFVLRRE